MTIEQIIEKLGPEITSQARRCKSEDQFRDLLKSNKISLSQEELELVLNFLDFNSTKKLRPNETKAVSGGFSKEQTQQQREILEFDSDNVTRYFL